MSSRDTPPFRADHVGSLLRPPELLRAREEHAAGRLTSEELRRIDGHRPSQIGGDAAPLAAPALVED